MGRSTKTLEDHILTTVIAIDKDKSSQQAVKWAVDNLLNKKHQCVLIHVRNQSLSGVDTTAVPKGGRPPTEAEMHRLFLPFRGFCARKGVEAKEVVLHDIEVSSALLDYINNNTISNIVVGASSRNAFTRSFKKLDVPSALSKHAPEYCTVYVIAKGKVQSCRSSSQDPFPTTDISSRQLSQVRLSPKYPIGSPVSEDLSRSSGTPESYRSVSSEMRSSVSDKSSDSIHTSPWNTYSGNKIPSSLRSNEKMDSSTRMPGSCFNVDSSLSGASDYSDKFSFLSIDTLSENLEYSYASGSSMSSLSSCTPHDLDAEMKKLRLELKQNMEIYNAACKEPLTVDQRGRELHQWNSGEAHKLEDAKHAAEEASLAMALMEKQRSKATMATELEVQKRKNVEMKVKQEEEERKRVMDALAHGNIQYRRYTLAEIESATEFFSNSLKVGEGGYGPVYRATLDHTAVAIKVLRPDLSQGLLQFQQEVEVLSGMNHPNMVRLVGACPEYGCLVYEYMGKGSLEDRLFQKDNSPPMSWRTRFRIASEIANALLFLHQTKPEPVVHRDLKPANILIDDNYVSKISDVGLARLVPASIADTVTQYHMTAAAGTFCYIDPEYQQTGMLSVKSDVYSLGVMLLQIITAKPPMGLTHQIERAIENGKLVQILDKAVKDWPIEEALSYAKLALKCCELRKKDRPDLGSIVVPELNRLRDLGMNGEDGYYTSSNNGSNSYSSIKGSNSYSSIKGSNSYSSDKGSNSYSSSKGSNSYSRSDASKEGMRYTEIQHKFKLEGANSSSSLTEKDGFR